MDFFDIDSLTEVITKNKYQIRKELDLIKFDKEKFIKESDNLLQVLEYSPKKKTSEKELIKTINTIKIKEEPKLNLEVKIPEKDKTDITTQKDSNINKPKEEENKVDIKPFIKSILFLIIQDVFEQIQKKENESDEEEDEFEKIRALREKKNKEKEDKLKKMNDEDEDDLGIPDSAKSSEKPSTLSSKIKSAMNSLSKLKVNLFETEKSINIGVSYDETVKDIKNKIIKFIIQKSIIKLKYNSGNFYEIKLDEDEDDFEVNVDNPPLEDYTPLLLLKPKSVTFLEKSEPEKDSGEKLLGDSKKISIKIYYKQDNNLCTRLISLESEDKIKNILKFFFDKKFLQNLDYDSYFIVEHENAEDIDNSINLENKIKHLSSLELNIYEKIKHYPKKGKYNKMINDSDKEKDSNEDNNSEGREFIYNEITAGMLEEFPVIKINKYNNRQERILGIDMYNLYNNMPKKKSGGLMNYLFKETKKPKRSTKNIKTCEANGDKCFYFDIKDEDGEAVKRMNFEVKDNIIRNKIVAKIKFLIKLNPDNQK
jgi:hypothetical protein